MSEHITEWLGAYHDGELRGTRLRRVEAHLTDCPTCRAALEELRALSQFLRDDVPDADFLPTERFAANLALHLPRRTEPPPDRTFSRVSWWLVPVGLLAAILFVDITSSISTAVSLAANTALFGGNLEWLQAGMPQMSWFSTAITFLGDQLGGPGLAVLSFLNDLNVRLAQFTRPLILQTLLGLGYVGWLLVWWTNQSKEANN